MMAEVIPICPALFVYPTPTRVFRRGVEVIGLVATQSYVVDRPDVGPDLHWQLTLTPRHGCYFRSYFSFWWERISTTISATILESGNKCCLEIYIMDQYECSYRGS